MSVGKAAKARAATAITREGGATDLGQQQPLTTALLQVESDLGEGVAIVDPHTQRFVYVNDALCQLYGYSAAELLALPSFLTLIVPEEQTAFRTRLAQRQQGHPQANHYELAVCHKDGGRITIEVALMQIPGPNGPQMVTLIRDITARTQAEGVLRQTQAALAQQVQERTAALAATNARLTATLAAQQRITAALHESEERFRVMADHAPVLLWMADTTGQCTFFNHPWLAFRGRTLEQEQGTGWLEGIHAEDRELSLEAYVTAFQAQRPFEAEYRLQRADGTYRWVWESARPRYTADGTFAGYIGSCLDITERKHAAAASLRLAAIVESSEDAIISKSLDGVITSWNAAAERIFGYGADEMIGQSILRLIPEDRHPEEQRILERLRRGERVDHFETVRRAKGGRLLDVSVTISPLRDAHGRIIGASKIARDITERKRAEEALRRAKEAAETADQTKSEFLATMSHELRTPVHVILGYTELLIDGAAGELPSQQMDIVRRIESNSRVLFDLISMVLDLDRLEAGRLPVEGRPVQVAALLAEVQAELQGLCDQSGLVCRWWVDPRLPALHTDPGKLKVVLKNLLSNAVKFTPAGSITVAAAEHQGGIEFSVTDTGIGIAAEAQAYIFEPFRQGDGAPVRAYGGSGLGLHIVQRLLAVLGGRITVASGVGQGSTFRVWLPLTHTPLLGSVSTRPQNSRNRSE